MLFYRQIFFYAVAAVAILLLYFFVDARDGGFPPCPFYYVTGFFCPGCGSQRGLSALVHGDVVAAAGYNILMVVSLPLFAYAIYFFLKTKGKAKAPLLYHPLFPKWVAVVVLFFWILRNIPVYPFTVLAP